MDKPGASFKTSKSEQTRERIIDTYVSLLDTTDFDKVSVSRLCKEAGIVRSTFYVYFSDIYEVIQTIEDELIAAFAHVDALALEHAAQDEARPKTEWGFPILPPYSLSCWFELCDANRMRLCALLGPHGDPYFEQKLRRQLSEHVSIMMDEDHMPQDELRRGFVESMVEMHLMLLRNWLLHEKTSLTRERIVTILNALRFGGNAMEHYLPKDTPALW